MMNILRALMEKVDNMQEQMGDINKEMETLKKNGREILEIKITVTNEECLAKNVNRSPLGKGKS